MSDVINKGWLKDKSGNRIAPKTLTSQIFDEEGNLLDKIVQGKYTTDQVSDEYSNTSTYAVGDYCINSNKLYKCITAITVAEEFDASKWKVTNVGNELQQRDDDFSSYVTTASEDLATEVQRLDDELDGKQATVTGAASVITSTDLKTGRALISNSNGKVAVSAITSTELNYLDGVTSKIQTQLDGKLSTAGGSITNDLKIINGGVLCIVASDGVSGAEIYQAASQQLVIRGSGETNYGVFLGVRDSIWAFSPHVSGKVNLGSSSYKWNGIYAVNGTINTSDKNLKTSITYLEDNDIYEQLFMKLLPCSYMFNNMSEDDSHDRTHIGFISQDVEQAMEELGLTSLDFAGFCKDPKIETSVVTETILDEETGEEKQIEKTIETVVEGEYIYSLRYSEFIGIITKVLQKTYNYTKELDARITALENAKEV